MSAGEFTLGLARLAAIVVPAAYAAHRVRSAYVRLPGRAVRTLADVVLTLSLLLVSAELLGLLSADRVGELIVLLVLVAVLCDLLHRRATAKARAATSTGDLISAGDAATSAAERQRAAGEPRDVSFFCAAAGVAVVAAQWCVATANSLGSGMSNFDTLWYHMPFAARFAQTGSVTGIYFTQADPFVAYYPANSELLGAIGIAALHDDFLSPLLNLGWLTVALLAAWCLGQPWQVRRYTLLAGCLVCSLPVLATTQPGEAFNDMMGLAVLLAGVALAANDREDLRVLGVAGLALGLAVGTKFTFIVPAAAFSLALCAAARRGRRLRVLAALLIGTFLTSALWYIRDLVDVGNPLGLELHVGPLRLPGPSSPLADALQRTVISQVTHLSEWSSRFIPGLDHAFGPLWPIVLVALLAGTIAGIALVRDRFVRATALAAGLAAITYLLLPTGASSVPGVNLFEVNLRYVTPALALAVVLVPIVLRLRAPRALTGTAIGMLLVLLATQFEHALWPTQPARHLAFMACAAIAVAAAISYRRVGRLRTPVAASLAGVAVLVLAGGAYAVQRHYLDRRYRLGDRSEPGLGAIYRWAQGVSGSRIAVYGSLLQYPLAGAHDTNTVGYLGEAAPNGGFRPIESCRTWRRTLLANRYQWVVIDYPGPTASLPIGWTAEDPAIHLVMHPRAGTFLFRIAGRPHPGLCA